jgi:cytochrome c peroxidase
MAIALAATLPYSAAHADTPYELELPRGFPAPRIPEDNPLTWEKVELGRLLFFDIRLSGNQTFSCASCHEPDKAFTDGRAQAVGSTGELHPRSSMTLANIAYAGTLTWAHPELFLLEKQLETPMFGTDPVELGLSGKEEELFARLREDPRYQRMFAEAFPDREDRFSLFTIGRAIASFERTLLSGNAPYDRFVFGLDDNAISPAAKRGEALFFDETHECFHCHVGFNLSTSIDAVGRTPERPFNNTALYNVRCSDFGLPPLELPWCNPLPDPVLCQLQTADQPLGCNCEGTGPQEMGCFPPDNTGIYALTHNTRDMGRFKPPTLRNIAVTAPYMHDGSIATLEEVLDHYAAGGRTVSEEPFAGVGRESPAKGAFVRGFALSERDKTDLIEFLNALTDEEFLTNPRFADPFAPVECPGDCNLDGAVAINEMTTAVNVSLDQASLAVCVVSDPSGDGRVAINELVLMIKSALDNCASD